MSKIDYPLEKIEAIVFDIDGVLSPSTVPLASNGHPVRMGNVKDGYAIQLAVKKGLKLAVISGGSSEEMNMRMKYLGVCDVFQNSNDKLPVLIDWMRINNLSSEQVAFMGDDIPDLKCLRFVGLSACPFDAVWEVKKTSVYISKFSGGYGAARDLIQEIMMAKGLWHRNDIDVNEIMTW